MVGDPESDSSSSSIINRKTKTRYDLINLISESGLSEYLDSKVPIDIFELAYAMGAKSVKEARILASGMLVPHGDEFMIILRESDNERRRRFSCAHELAHVLLDAKYNKAFRQPNVASPSALEKRCDDLASLLLMPEGTFRKYATAYEPSIKNIVRLHRIFLTSIQATALRYVDEIKKPCVLLVSRIRSGSSGLKLRVSWSKQNTTKSNGSPLVFVPIGSAINIESASLANKTSYVHSSKDDLRIGGLRVKARTESKSFGTGASRYVLSLVFPEQ